MPKVEDFNINTSRSNIKQEEQAVVPTMATRKINLESLALLQERREQAFNYPVIQMKKVKKVSKTNTIKETAPAIIL